MYKLKFIGVWVLQPDITGYWLYYNVIEFVNILIDSVVYLVSISYWFEENVQ